MLDCVVTSERWPLIEPFVIARETMTHVATIVVTVADRAGRIGRGEAAGVDYDGETPTSMSEAIDGIRNALTDDLDGEALTSLLPAGGARNALDCALWDLRAKQSGIAVAKRAGLAPLRMLDSALTLGLGDDASLRGKLETAKRFKVIKIKADATRHIERVRLVREACPRARLIVDANQAWSRSLLDALMPELASLGVALIEQPVPRGDDAVLDGLSRIVPIAADESCTDRTSLLALIGRYDAINIKLDKCGGLTEAFALLFEARRLGFIAMVGNMCGTSLAMAPAFLVGQRCEIVDLDGPLLQSDDRPHAMQYVDGCVSPPTPELWG